ncbi:MAG: NAD(P)/FAD-dependent oxidoreductase [Pseudomonadota bacterium]
MAGERIAVLGGGPMGLATAFQLARDGHNPVLFEAGPVLGGMTASFDFNGLTIERFYHFHCTSDHAFLTLLDELGIGDRLCWVETKMGYFYEGKVQAWGDPIALLRFSGLSLWAKFRYGLHAFASTRRQDWQRLDKLEATTWLKRWVGEEAFEVLWRRLFEYKFYDYAYTLSAAWIWSRIHRLGRSRYSLFREKLGHLEGGSHTLLIAIETDIRRHGGEIHTSAPVSRVVIEDGTVRGIQQGETFHPFNKVISTIPLPFVPRLIPDLPQEILRQYAAVKNVAVVCVIAKLRKPVTDKFWLNTHDPDMDIPGLVEFSNLRPLDQHLVYVPFYMPGDHPKYAEEDAVFLDKVRRYLQKINPALQDEDIIELRASRYRFAQPVCQPGHLGTLPPVDLPVRGLWAADTSYYYPEDRGISESVDFGRKLARMATA